MASPVLIVYALVNRPYIMDLQDGRSLVQGLLCAGLDVYLLDWGYPDKDDKALTLDDYITATWTTRWISSGSGVALTG